MWHVAHEDGIGCEISISEELTVGYDEESVDMFTLMNVLYMHRDRDVVNDRSCSIL